MKIMTKAILGLLFLTAFLVNTSQAQANYPNKPINIYVAYKAGGSADALARQIAKTIEDQHGWDFSSTTIPVPTEA